MCNVNARPVRMYAGMPIGQLVFYTTELAAQPYNLKAGAKYMDRLMEKYFPDANFSEGNRPLFAFASYNAGPGNISRMRKEAKKRGLDPDKWFNNVELVTAEKIGAETTTYVRNIYKYYVAYKLTLEAQEMARKAREGLKPGNP
jgi:membrane-bound lytic murein transglycosylase MltF